VNSNSKNLEEKAIAKAIYATCVRECVDQLIIDPLTRLEFRSTIKYNSSILPLCLQEYVYSQGFPHSCVIEAPIELNEMQTRIQTALSEVWQQTHDLHQDSHTAASSLQSEEITVISLLPKQVIY